MRGTHSNGALIDVCVVNTGTPGSKVLDPYQAQAARPVENDIRNLERMGIRVLGADLLRHVALSAA